MNGRLMCFGLILGAVIAGTVNAHTRWDPNGLIKPRSTRDNIKSGPCGDPRTNNPTVLEAGATIEVAFESAIFHKGYFRIAFSPANDEGFDDHVLAENIKDISGMKKRKHTITLPDMECDGCTLQLIQSMLDRNPPSNYFHCADIKLVKSTTADTTPPPQISNLLGVAGDTSVTLNWANPKDSDFWQVLVLAKLNNGVSTHPEDGKRYAQSDSLANEARVAYVGSGSTTTFNDFVTPGEDSHFAVYTFDRAYNYSQAVAGEVTIPAVAPNFAPKVSLDILQDDSNDAYISAAGGHVTLTAQVTDENVEDTHQFNWLSANRLLVDIDNTDSSFTFDPAQLSDGDYSVSVAVIDSGSPAMTANAKATLTVNKDGNKPEEKSGAFGVWALLLLSMVALRARLRGRGFKYFA